MIGASINRAIMFSGPTGTGKTTEAIKQLGDPLIYYANEYDVEDNFSIPRERGILIEEIHHKPNINLIVKTINEYRGTVCLTALTGEKVSKRISNISEIRYPNQWGNAMKNNYWDDAITELAPHSLPPVDGKMSDYELLTAFLKSTYRNQVAEVLKLNKPHDKYFLEKIVANINSMNVAWVDAKVKRRWSQDYFYELLAFSIPGDWKGKINFAKNSYSNYQKIKICRRLGMKDDEIVLLEQLLQDESFAKHVTSKVSNEQRRALKLPEKKKKIIKKEKVKTLDEWL